MKRDTEGSMQHVVSLVLRIGVVASAALGVAGSLFYLLAHGGETVNYRTFRAASLGGLAFDARSLMLVALLVLVLTPIVRVLVSLIGFIKERDRVYIVVTSVVLLTLIASLFTGKTHG